MVDRAGYFVDGDTVTRSLVKIGWSLGWDREAKIIYTAELHKALSTSIRDAGKMLEVTTACVSDYGKACSPFYIETPHDMMMEDFFPSCDEGELIKYDGFVWPSQMREMAFTHMYCKYGQHLLPILREFDVFTDIFYNPTKDGALTQALPCAMLKLMDQRGELDCVNSTAKFIYWCRDHIRR